MKFYILLSVVIAAFVIIECSHTFLGTNVGRPQVYHKNVKYSSYFMRKRVENFTFTLPAKYGYARSIQGILAYDLGNSGASANVTVGGLGYNHLTLRMKSERGSSINYDVYIYA